jgi:flagellin-like protein
MYRERNQKAVSPVIGVILMVAITVILAAVIGTTVLGFGGQVNENVRAGVSVESSGNGAAQVNWVSGGNADYLNITVAGDATMDADYENDQKEIIRVNSTGSSLTILPKKSATCNPCDRVHVRPNAGDVAYWNSVGTDDYEITSCDINKVCESEGLISDTTSSAKAANDVPDDGDIVVTVVAVKENGAKTTVFSEEVGS